MSKVIGTNLCPEEYDASTEPPSGLPIRAHETVIQLRVRRTFVFDRRYSQQVSPICFREASLGFDHRWASQPLTQQHDSEGDNSEERVSMTI